MREEDKVAARLSSLNRDLKATRASLDSLKVDFNAVEARLKKLEEPRVDRDPVAKSPVGQDLSLTGLGDSLQAALAAPTVVAEIRAALDYNGPDSSIVDAVMDLVREVDEMRGELAAERDRSRRYKDKVCLAATELGVDPNCLLQAATKLKAVVGDHPDGVPGGVDAMRMILGVSDGEPLIPHVKGLLEKLARFWRYYDKDGSSAAKTPTIAEIIHALQEMYRKMYRKQCDYLAVLGDHRRQTEQLSAIREALKSGGAAKGGEDENGKECGPSEV